MLPPPPLQHSPPSLLLVYILLGSCSPCHGFQRGDQFPASRSLFPLFSLLLPPTSPPHPPFILCSLRHSVSQDAARMPMPRPATALLSHDARGAVWRRTARGRLARRYPTPALPTVAGGAASRRLPHELMSSRLFQAAAPPPPASVPGFPMPARLQVSRRASSLLPHTFWFVYLLPHSSTPALSPSPVASPACACCCCRCPQQPTAPSSTPLSPHPHLSPPM